MLNELINNVKKRLAINALVHANKQYDELPEEIYYIKKRGFTLLAIMISIYLGIDYSGNNGIDEDLGKYTVLITTLMLGGMYSYYWPKYFFRIKKIFRKILNIDINNEDLLISHFDNVILPTLRGRRIYGMALYGVVSEGVGDSPVDWDDFSTELSNQEIETLMSQHLTETQKNYISDIIFKEGTLRYTHLQTLQNMEDVNSNEKKEECVANFLKSKNIQIEFLNNNTVNETELEYDYKKIL